MSVIGFADAELEETFRREGFVVAPLLSPDDVEKLKTAYSQLQGSKVANFSIDAMDPDYRRTMNQGIHEVIYPHVRRYLPHAKIFGCNYVVKNAGNPHLALHQDNSVCEEPKYSAVLCWCPLHDVTEENGCLTIIPRSHRWTTQRRAFGDQLEVSPFRDVIGLLKEKFEKPAPISAGTAIFYDPRTMHGSLPNRTDKPRVVTLSGTLHEEAPLLFHHRHSATEVEAFAADQEFFWKEMFVFKRPLNTPSLGRAEMLEEGPFTEEEFLRRVAAAAEN